MAEIKTLRAVAQAAYDVPMASVGALAGFAQTFKPDEVLAMLDELEALRAGALPSDPLQRRLSLLRQASRPGELLTDAGGVTVQGMVLSAITKLEREIAKRKMGG